MLVLWLPVFFRLRVGSNPLQSPLDGSWDWWGHWKMGTLRLEPIFISYILQPNRSAIISGVLVGTLNLEGFWSLQGTLFLGSNSITSFIGPSVRTISVDSFIFVTNYGNVPEVALVLVDGVGWANNEEKEYCELKNNRVLKNISVSQFLYIYGKRKNLRKSWLKYENYDYSRCSLFFCCYQSLINWYHKRILSWFYTNIPTPQRKK